MLKRFRLAGSRSSLGRRAIVGTLWAALESFGQNGIQLLVFITLARLLGPQAYGLVGIALIVTTIGTLLVGRAGWAESVIQKRDLKDTDLDSLFWFVAVLSIALWAAATVASKSIAVWFATEEVAQILPWLALSIPLSALALVPGASLRRELQFRPLAVRSLVGVAVGGAAGIAAAFAGAGAWSLVIHQLTTLFAEALVLWTAVRWRPRLRFSVPRLKHLVSFTLAVLAAKVIYVGEDLILRTLIARTLGAVGVGYYAVSRRILILSESLLVTPLIGVGMPLFAKLGTRPERLREALSLGMQAGTVLAFPCYIGLALIVPDLLPLVFGQQWAAAVPAAQFAMLVGSALPINRLCETFLLALGHPKAHAVLHVCATTLLIFLLLLPERITVEAVMAAIAARTYLMVPLTMVWVQWITGVDVRGAVRSLAPLLGATLLMAMAVLAVQTLVMAETGAVVRLASSVLVGAGVYSLAVLALGRPLVDRVMRQILQRG